jgi:hypothetical protein
MKGGEVCIGKRYSMFKTQSHGDTQQGQQKQKLSALEWFLVFSIST